MIQITPYYSKSVHIFGSILHTEKPSHTIVHMLDVVKKRLESVCLRRT